MRHVMFVHMLAIVKPLYSTLVHRRLNTPRVYVRLSVILSEEVRFLVKRHYHNGGHCAAKHRSQVKASQFRVGGPHVAVKKLSWQSVAKPFTSPESASQSNLWLNSVIQSIQLTSVFSH
ncbi:hypothetical protein GOODEAATRI_008101 [Goodea atripinnis]|uniref:Secreted protein n=1 Tax=Goodea atripinnis TaxID=208336 RepID=A0ABV0N8X5_9TELE